MLTGRRRRRGAQILAEPTRTDKAVFPGAIATQHYARGVAYASKGMVPEAQAEQKLFEEALQVSRACPSCTRSVLTEIYLCHACS